MMGDFFYMHNFRGFNNAFVPVRKVNFLLGENSSGKSSFLKLMRIISSFNFIFSLDFRDDEETSFGGYDDIVSACAQDKTSFKIGRLTTRKLKEGGVKINFFSVRYVNIDGSPKYSEYCQCFDNEIIHIKQVKNKIYFRIHDLDRKINTDEEAIQVFRDFSCGNSDERDFSQMEKGMIGAPIPFIISAVRSKSGRTGKDDKHDIEIRSFGLPGEPIWFSPIRTKPRRFYDGLTKSFSPDGDHTPYILRRRLTNRRSSVAFISKLDRFGKESGLFETISSHRFGKGPQVPFEILIKFSGRDLNINNVGYGVSQVLPLIVDFLLNGRGKTFAVQQPEVHLHPRAQAALGDLIFELAKAENHTFFLETHSDYLVDRYRVAMHNSDSSPQSHVLFFQNKNGENTVSEIKISQNGNYDQNQPKEFKDFFIKEEIKLLEI